MSRKLLNTLSLAYLTCLLLAEVVVADEINAGVLRLAYVLGAVMAVLLKSGLCAPAPRPESKEGVLIV